MLPVLRRRVTKPEPIYADVFITLTDVNVDAIIVNTETQHYVELGCM
jgi:hypothetical protein